MHHKFSSKIYYFKYENLEDMLKLIISSSQSALGIGLALYQIKYKNNNILFIHNTYFGSNLIHYINSYDTNNKKYIRLNLLTGKYEFSDNIGNTPHSIYIPILQLLSSTLEFPI